MGTRANKLQQAPAPERHESLCAGIQKVLELLATGAPFRQVLESLVLTIEGFSEGMLGSIQLLAADGRHLRHGVGPNLPEAYNRLLDGFEIGPQAGSCGTSAFRRAPVFVSDISTDPLWARVREVGKRFDLRACWSTPIFSRDKEVLGTFAMYYREVRSPTEWELQLIEKATHVASIAIDHHRALDERRRAFEALERSLRDQRDLIESIDGIVWEADTGFRFYFVSSQALRILGYPLARWLNEPSFWLEHLHPDDREWATKFCREQVDRLSAHRFVYRFIAADGRTVWISDIVSVIAESGRPVRIRGVMIDVTRTKTAEIALARANEELQRVAASISDYLWSATVDSSGKFTYRYYSPVVLKITGRPAEFYMEDPTRWASTVHEEDRRRVWVALERLVQRESSFEQSEYRVVHPDGSLRWVRDSVTVTSLPDGSARINGVVSDITSRKEMEKAREELLRREREARLDAEKSVSVRDDFISVASHELKTPLTPLRMHLQLIKRRLTQASPQAPLNVPLFLGALDESDRELSRLSRFIDDLLDVSRISAGRLALGIEEVDLSNLVLETVARYESEFREAGYELRLEADPEIRGYWDPIRLEQVLVNLLTNAMKYGEKKPIEVSVHQKGNQAELRVRDHGIGIAKEDQNRIFVRFERISPTRRLSGLGLGLYITREIVMAHGGSIRVESAPSKGSTFIVELPVKLAVPIARAPRNG